MSASLYARLCAKIVRNLGSNVVVLNYVPFGTHIISTFRSYAVKSSYSDRAKIDLAHRKDRTPIRNLSFCRFIAEKIRSDKYNDSVRILEIGAGRCVNANLLHEFQRTGSFTPRSRFVLLDKYVDPAGYLDAGIDAETVLGDASNVDLSRFGVIDIGITRATLSIMAPRDAKSILLEMEKICKTIIINEVATPHLSSRTIIRKDKHMIHPYQKWLQACNRTPKFYNWSENDETFNGIIAA